jgi:hypothetical protein
MERPIRGTNDCDTKWVVYGLKCVDHDLWYIGKTLTAFKTRWSNHKSKLNKNIEIYKNKGERAISDLKSEGKIEDFRLIKHFCEEHDSIFSLKWCIIHAIGKKGNQPAANLLRWEHAYIDYFSTVWPKGLNSVE